MDSYKRSKVKGKGDGTLEYRDEWKNRSLLTDWTVTWLNGFVEHLQGKTEVLPEFLHLLSEKESAEVIYKKWCSDLRDKGKTIKGTVMRLTVQGTLWYSIQLTIVELCTIAGIYLIRLIIDYLHDQSERFEGYSMTLFLSFTATRFVAIHVRNYYDLHVYNHFRYIQTAIQTWIFEDVSKLRLWTKIGVEDQF